MDFCLRCLWSNENFRDVIFTDESTVKMDTSPIIPFKRKQQTAHARYVGKPKHPYSVSLSKNNLNHKYKYIDYE